MKINSHLLKALLWASPLIILFLVTAPWHVLLATLLIGCLLRALWHFMNWVVP